MTRRPPPQRSDFAQFDTVPTRWNDNDIYGHMNNAVHYQIFDTVVNDWLARRGLWHPQAREHFVVAETGCRYHAELRYPDPVEVGLAITHIGTTSLRWHLGLFGPGATVAAADGVFVQVYVTHADMRPTPMPDALRSVMASLTAPGRDLVGSRPDE